MLRKILPILSLLLAILCAMGVSCKKDCPTQPAPLAPSHTAITLQVTFTSTRWCRLQWTNDSSAVSHRYLFLRNNRDTLFNDSVASSAPLKILQDTVLKPGTTYSYWVYRIVNGQRWDSATVSVRTLDTTRDNYTWETIRIGQAGSVLYGIWGNSPNSVWMCGGGDNGGCHFFNVVHDVNGSLEFLNASVAGGGFNACYGVSDSSIYFVGLATLAHWDGHEFSYVLFYGDSVPVRAGNLSSVWVTRDESEVFAVGDSGRIVHRSADGKWEVQPSGSTLNLTKVIGFSNRDVYAVGTKSNYEGVILKYDGATWGEIAHAYDPPPNDTTLLAGNAVGIGGESADSLYACGVYIYKRNGSRWKLADAPCNDPSYHGGPCGAYRETISGTWNNMWVGGDFGYLLHFDGEKWVDIRNFFDLNSNLVWIGILPFPNEMFILGSDHNGAVLLHGK